MDDRRELEPDFWGVVDDVDVEVDGPAAAAASSFTIRFLLISPSASATSNNHSTGGCHSPIRKPSRDLLKRNSNSLRNLQFPFLARMRIL